MEAALREKRKKLQSIIRSLKSVVVAFSGGVDSTLVLTVAHSVLGKNVLAVTARSDSLPQRELEEAKRLAEAMGVEHRIIETGEMQSADYTRNPADRCYYCKSELYSRLQAVAKEKNFSHIVNGINLDDLGDHRPGITAAKEADVRSPLSEAGLNKEDVRALSKELKLSTWKKHAMACLSSRVPYGQPITPEKLAMIEQAEDFLFSLGFTQLRVRHHGDIARIELPPKHLAGFFSRDMAAKVESRFREIGFQYTTLDITGYRAGSLNEALEFKK